ncbi:MAG: plasmid pRiA4b ORF-3 family protein [Desulfuromonadales bacterium]|nr:plasmid pRiA4b ORF-3 family protein [Desulfuromonadales bacterium]
MPGKTFFLKITLLETQPKIWRRFLVPADITLDRLHDVIQIVMGWHDAHLHEFQIGGKKFTESPEFPEDGEADGLFRLGDLVKKKGTVFRYLYDFGDDWLHEIVLERTTGTRGPEESPIECLGGEGACPPEDVGGIPGYEEFCQVMKSRRGARYREHRDWFGSDFSPEHFDLGQVNHELLTYLRWSRPRLLFWDSGA